jgi:hypothetical protein
MPVPRDTPKLTRPKHRVPRPPPNKLLTYIPGQLVRTHTQKERDDQWNDDA